MWLGVVAFFASYLYFSQPLGLKIEYNNFRYMWRLNTPFVILLVSLYVGLYYYGGKKIAMQLGGGMAIFYLLAVVVGYLLHG